MGEGWAFERVAGPLTDDEVDQWVELGHVTLRRAFPRDVAAAVVRALGEKAGVDLYDPDTWRQQSIWVKESYHEPPFTDAITPRLHAAVEQLVGPGRYEQFDRMGWWPVTFPGCPPVENWHLEGSFHHHPWSPEQAVVPIFVFTDIPPGGGGTQVVERSHWAVAELLWAAEPDGISADDTWRVVGDRLWPDDPPRHVVTAEAGDVVLLHPFMFHSGDGNDGTGPRVIAQPRIDMTEHKRSEPPLFPVDVATAATRPR